jgi:hypothetical protein
MRRILRKMVEQDFVDIGHTSRLPDSAEVEEIKAGKVWCFYQLLIQVVKIYIHNFNQLIFIESDVLNA